MENPDAERSDSIAGREPAEKFYLLAQEAMLQIGCTEQAAERNWLLPSLTNKYFF
jgi:hypothetical protein